MPHLRTHLPRLAGLVGLVLSATAWSADEPAEIRKLLAQGEAPAALQRAEKALAADPRNAQLRFVHAVVLMDMGRDAEALALFTRLSQDFPELPDPFNNIALLQVRAGALESALQSLQAALRNDPGHRTARSNLGRVYAMLAVRTFGELAATGPLEPALQRQLEAARVVLAAPPAR